MTYRWTLIRILLALFASPAARAQDAAFGTVTRGPGWVYTRLGSQNDVKTKTTFGVLFEGGGRDVNEAYEWMCQHAGNGFDFLVIRSTGTADYNPYIQKLCPGINSVSTLKITNRLGSQAGHFVQQTILNAEALFIAGGDQSDYVRFYQQTPVNDAINALARREACPSAAPARATPSWLQFAFSALINTITSAQALRNPFDDRITIDNGFLFLSPLLGDTIADDHFVTRDRMGRAVTFLARIAHDPGRSPTVRHRLGRKHRLLDGGRRQGRRGRLLDRLFSEHAWSARNLPTRDAADLPQSFRVPDHQERDVRCRRLGRDARNRVQSFSHRRDAHFHPAWRWDLLMKSP